MAIPGRRRSAPSMALCTEATCNVDPESARNYEIGAKAEVAGGKLLLAGSLFRNERNQFPVPSDDPTHPRPGARRPLARRWRRAQRRRQDHPGMVGHRQLYLSRCRAAPVGRRTALPDPAAGATASDPDPKHSGSLFTTYEFPFGLNVGYGLTYQGKFATNQRTATSDDDLRSTTISSTAPLCPMTSRTVWWRSSTSPI